MPLVADSIRTLTSALIIAAIVIAGLVLGRDVLIPIAVATILAFMLQPVTRWLTHRHVPHAVAVTGVFASLIAAVVGLSIVFSSQVLELTADLSSYRQNMVEKARMLNGVGSSEGVLKRAFDSVDRLGREIGEELSKPKSLTPDRDRVVVAEPSNTSGVIDHVASLVAPAAKIGLALLFTLFLLMQHQDLRDRLVRVAGTDNLSDTTAAMSDAGERLSKLFLAQAILNVGFGIFVGFALWIIGVPNPILWGCLTALMRFVPFIGSFIAAVPPIVLAACVDPGWGMAIATLLLFVIGEPFMGHVVEPILLGSKAGLSPFAMVAAASFWTLLWGPVGLILAAPITMVIVVLGRYIGGLEFFSILLGDEPALSPEQELYHRILVGDAIAAADQIEEATGIATGKGDTGGLVSLGEASDSIVIPALRLAAVDQRRSKLDREQAKELRETLAEVSALLAANGDPDRAPAAGAATVLVVPAQGPIDAAAAEYVAGVVQATTACPTRAISHTTGLTALSDLGAGATALGAPATRPAGLGEAPSTIILVTVGGIEHQHLRFIVRRAVRDFATTRIMVLDASGHQLTPADRDKDAVSDVLRTTSLTEAMSQIACVMPEKAETGKTETGQLLAEAD